jgi:hypothetical protein
MGFAECGSENWQARNEVIGRLGVEDGRMVLVSVGEDLIAERRRRRRAGDPRLTDADREFLGRLVDGDRSEEFQAALDAVSESDPLLGGGGAGDGD